MKKRLKTKDVELLEFWNDSHKLTMLFQPLDVAPPEEIKIPTNILLSLVKVLPNIPIDIKAIYYGNNSRSMGRFSYTGSIRDKNLS